MAIQIAQEPHADEVLSNDPFALLVGMLLDQQYPMEHAFRGPAKVLDRFATLDPAKIADAEPEAFPDLCPTPPAPPRQRPPARRPPQGPPLAASTITMQVAKNRFLCPAKSYVRKVI